MSMEPSSIRSLAISAEDLVAAVEANVRGRRETVLRVTPPYSGRMRARLHVVGTERRDRETIHVSPERLLTDAAPAFPNPDEIEDLLRESDEPYSVERHRERYEQRISEWREAVPDYVVDTISLPAVDAPVTVYLLGGK